MDEEPKPQVPPTPVPAVPLVFHDDDVFQNKKTRTQEIMEIILRENSEYLLRIAEGDQIWMLDD